MGERMRNGQWLAIGIAAAGVLYLTISYGSPPLIALTLALTFGAYGLIKKTTSLNALEGLSLETVILFVPTFGYLLYLSATGQNSFGLHDVRTSLLLSCAGAATALPLLFFAAGARRIPLYMVGVLQYVAPSLQFILGVFVYNEPFTMQRLIGFAFIWCALLLYTLEGIVWRRRIAVPRGAAVAVER
ncbi:MAG: EamA family transporter [Caldilineaceae bacterium]